MLFRIGQGFDIHNISQSVNAESPFILGGICISQDISIEAHSDGDTLLHALIDAILGALGEQDIGDLFPPSSSEWKDISSVTLLQMVLKRTEYTKKWVFGNIDITVVLQSPRLGENKARIRQNLQNLLQADIPISIKAKTFEKPCEQVWVYASVLLTLL